MSATHRARAITAVLAGAESLAALLRDHGHPARVVVGRRQGVVRIRVARATAGHTGRRARGRGAAAVLLPVCRTVVQDWLMWGLPVHDTHIAHRHPPI